MSDGEYEKFEITDYDLENEFNPNRGRRRPTKNQQIYGKYNYTYIFKLLLYRFRINKWYLINKLYFL